MKLGQKIAVALATVGLLTVSKPAHADFYDGYRGPKSFQLDQRVSLSDGTPNYTLLPKAFIDSDGNGRGVFAVTPFNYTPGHDSNVGAGIGGFYDLGGVSLLGVVPVVYSSEGKVLHVNPTLYATVGFGHLLLDPRLSYLANISGDGTTHRLGFGATVGYTIDNVVLGLDAEAAIDPAHPSETQVANSFAYQGIIRIDLDADHRNWMQVYLSKDAVGVGFRANFGE